MHPRCIHVDEDAFDGEATDEDATDEDATDEDATDEDTTDEDATDATDEDTKIVDILTAFPCIIPLQCFKFDVPWRRQICLLLSRRPSVGEDILSFLETM